MYPPVRTAERLEHVRGNEGSKQAGAVLPDPATALRSQSRGCGYKKPSDGTSHPQGRPVTLGGASCCGHVSPPRCLPLLLPIALVPSARRDAAARPWAAMRMLGQAKAFAIPSAFSTPLDPPSLWVSPRARGGNVGPRCGIQEGAGRSSGPGTGTAGAPWLRWGCMGRGHVGEQGLERSP